MSGSNFSKSAMIPGINQQKILILSQQIAVDTVQVQSDNFLHIINSFIWLPVSLSRVQLLAFRAIIDIASKVSFADDLAAACRTRLIEAFADRMVWQPPLHPYRSPHKTTHYFSFFLAPRTIKQQPIGMK
jgi:hypothetical protein